MDKKINNKTLRERHKPAMDALYKKAVGYSVAESVEEYIKSAEDQLILNKKKITKKHVPPDITALKLLLDLQGESDLSAMTDEELKKEKQRLLKLLGDIDDDEN